MTSQGIRQWEDFVDQYASSLQSFCARMLRNHAEAQDVVQEVFETCIHHESALREARSPKAWVYTIARRKCIDRLRWYRRALKLFQPPKSEDVSGAEMLAPGHGFDQDLKITLSALVNALPARQREIFILRHWHGFSTNEVAALIGTQPSTVKTHLKRAVDKIAKELTQAGQCKPTEHSMRQSSMKDEVSE